MSGICDKCGQTIEIRYYDGRYVPFHPYGACGGEKSANKHSSQVEDFVGLRENTEDRCNSTTCPKCGDEVFFIRHNGGSVWLDPPLGPPWPKHGCFVDEKTKYRTLAQEFSIDQSQCSHESTLGVVQTTFALESKSLTSAIFNTGAYGQHKIFIKGNAGFLSGKLCILNMRTWQIFPVELPEYKFSLMESVEIVKPYPLLSLDSIVRCSVCSAQMKSRYIILHMIREHGKSKKS